MNTHTNSLKCNDITIGNSAATNLFSSVISTVGESLKTTVSRWRTHRQNKISRQSFQSLLKLDDNILKDIGVTRYDVLWANKLPLSRNAASELNKISKNRR